MDFQDGKGCIPCAAPLNPPVDGGSDGGSNCTSGAPCIQCGSQLTCQVQGANDCCAGFGTVFCYQSGVSAQCGGTHVRCSSTSCPSGSTCCASYEYKNGVLVVGAVNCALDSLGTCNKPGTASLCDPTNPKCPSDRACKAESKLGPGFYACLLK